MHRIMVYHDTDVPVVSSSPNSSRDGVSTLWRYFSGTLKYFKPCLFLRVKLLWAPSRNRCTASADRMKDKLHPLRAERLIIRKPRVRASHLPNQVWRRSWWSGRTVSCRPPRPPQSGCSCTRTRSGPGCASCEPRRWTLCSPSRSPGTASCWNRERGREGGKVWKPEWRR